MVVNRNLNTCVLGHLLHCGRTVLSGCRIAKRCKGKGCSGAVLGVDSVGAERITRILKRLLCCCGMCSTIL